jgi:hypothetical protein
MMASTAIRTAKWSRPSPFPSCGGQVRGRWRWRRSWPATGPRGRRCRPSSGIVECPSSSITVRGSSPWSSRNVANACRGSCRCSQSRPALLLSCSKRRFTFRGSIGRYVDERALLDRVAYVSARHGSCATQAGPVPPPPSPRSTDRDSGPRADPRRLAAAGYLVDPLGAVACPSARRHRGHQPRLAPGLRRRVGRAGDGRTFDERPTPQGTGATSAACTSVS